VAHCHGICLGPGLRSASRSVHPYSSRKSLGRVLPESDSGSKGPQIPHCVQAIVSPHVSRPSNRPVSAFVRLVGRSTLNQQRTLPRSAYAAFVVAIEKEVPLARPPSVPAMAMAVDNRQQSQLNGMGYDPLRFPQPHFTNPWAPASGTSQQQMYQTSIAPNVSSGLETHAPSQPVPVQRPTSIALPYHGLQVTAPSLGSGIALPDGSFAADNLLETSQDLLSRSYTGAYGTAASANNNNTYAPTSAPYSQMEYGTSDRNPYAFSQGSSRRSSHPSVPSTAFYESLENQRQRQSSLVDVSRLNSQPQRNSFSDALDASRGMVSLSQADITPRNIYGNQGSSRSSTDSYGFPSTHSAHSSISSASYNGNYYAGGEGSVTDYSSASESVDLTHSRTLPRPNALMGANIPPAPQSMMGQFSSKVSSSSQKKHKCKICDKRFTRPSSLQTHMYSHTGEKPFACEVEGCGRHFSVVSNLRRHRKVHKGEGLDHPSPDDA
jgi:hypothetical protein